MANRALTKEPSKSHALDIHKLQQVHQYAAPRPLQQRLRTCSTRTMAPDRSWLAARLTAEERRELQDVRTRLDQQLRMASLDEKQFLTKRSQGNPDLKSHEEDYHPSMGWRPLPHHLTKEQLWQRVRDEALVDASSEPALASNLYSLVLSQASLERSLASILAAKLANPTLLGMHLVRLIEDAYAEDPGLIAAACADLQAVYDRDPACDKFTQALLHFKGYQAIQSHRVAHWLLSKGRRALALAFQSRISEAFHVDIHPAAKLGFGILIDHATGVVIGETAVVGDNVSMLHRVTLGGSGTGRAIRHPTIGHGVLLGAGATVLGPVSVGAGSKIGAGSVVVSDIPQHAVAVGVPARIVKRDLIREPVSDMDQCVDFVLNYEI